MAEPVVSVELDLDSKNFDKELDAKKSKIERTGKEAGDKFSKSFGSNIFGGLTRQIAILGATVVGALSFREAIRGAIEAQNSLNAFNRSLALTGQFSEKASSSFGRCYSLCRFTYSINWSTRCFNIKASNSGRA